MQENFVQYRDPSFLQIKKKERKYIDAISFSDAEKYLDTAVVLIVSENP